MAPIYSQAQALPEDVQLLLKLLLDTMADDAVWYDFQAVEEFQEAVDSGEHLGNIATTPGYKRVLGVENAGQDWREMVQNPEYSDSYEAWVKAGPTDNQWVHRLIWKRPDNGKICKGYSRANWHPSGLIVGQVFEDHPAPRIIQGSVFTTVLTILLAIIAWEWLT